MNMAILRKEGTGQSKVIKNMKNLKLSSQGRDIAGLLIDELGVKIRERYYGSICHGALPLNIARPTCLR